MSDPTPYPPFSYLPPPPAAPTPPVKRKGNKRAAILLVCGLGGLLVIGGIAASASPPAQLAATSTTSTTRATTSTTSQRAAMEEWAEQAMPTLNRLSGAIGDAGDAASDYDMSSLYEACSDMSTQVTRMRNYLPVPDPNVDVELSAALDDYDKSADWCIRFTASYDSSDGLASARYMESGTRHINNATDALDFY